MHYGNKVLGISQFLKKLCAGQNSIKGNFHLNIHQEFNGAAHRHEYPHYTAT
jgi:hypothetical protein